MADEDKDKTRTTFFTCRIEFAKAIPNNKADTWPLEVMFPDIYKIPNKTEYIFRRFFKTSKLEYRIGLSKALKKKYKPGDYVMIRLIGRIYKQNITAILEDPQTGRLLDRNIHIKNIFPYVLPEPNEISMDEVQS
ncbi:hypothetical protein PIROE2DRAFT_11435 [Piromyces sp. E2]|nr:hypothetical protein PIROE2DRAFT_11435 [Piromyces sp. E2]|eukprot:OUM62329.1 hypothetical protein PIROE2DRAFT_11435 [Piromyces sp. E2]